MLQKEGQINSLIDHDADVTSEAGACKGPNVDLEEAVLPMPAFSVVDSPDSR